MYRRVYRAMTTASRQAFASLIMLMAQVCVKKNLKPVAGIIQTFARLALSDITYADCFGTSNRGGNFMKRIISFALAALFVLGLSVAASANTPYINRRERHEQRRINQGIRSGELTRREAVRLEAGQARIRTYERFAKADGHVSYRERRQLDRMLDRSGRNIYRQKHDGQDRLP